jgi:Protein of unknown function (DUF3562)
MVEVVADPSGTEEPEDQVRGLVVPSFVETIVERVATEFGAAREEVRSRALELLSGYADARVRSFVPILVEKRLRETYRTPGPAG